MLPLKQECYKVEMWNRKQENEFQGNKDIKLNFNKKFYL